MKTCEMGLDYHGNVCGKPATHVCPVSNVLWENGRPVKQLPDKMRYVCDLHAKGFIKRGNRIKKLHVIPIA